MNEMNYAKNLIREAAEPFDPERSPSTRRTGSPRRPEPGGPSDHIRRMTGREGPESQFSPEETSQLKDVMIMMLAKMTGSDLDAQIGQALMTGQELEPGQLQHIIDEARQLNVPETHGALLQKIFSKLQQR